MAAAGTVLFDLDDTICTYDRDTDEVLAVAFDRAGVDPYFDADDWATVIPELEHAPSQAHFRRTCFSMLAERAGRDPEHAVTVADAYGAERDHTAVRLLPGARTAIETLGRAHRLGIVTNAAPEVQRPKLDALGLTGVFETVVHAGTETLAKPHPSSFEVALDRLDATASDTVHVGNSLDADVAGAKRAGLDAVWIPEGPSPDPASVLRPDHTLETLHDLPTALGVTP